MIFWFSICAICGAVTGGLAAAIALDIIPVSYWWCLAPAVAMNAFLISWCAYESVPRKQDDQ